MELDPNPPAASEQREETLTLNGLRILLVEDNDLNLEIAQYLLAHAGASFDTAHNGKAAVKKFLEAPVGYYDIILMDVMMPEMNGYETTKAIRNMPDRPDGKKIPIIAMTANAFAEDIQAALDAGMDGHVAKPVDMGVLLSVITKYIER